jgi:hypothetical protein
MKCFEIDETFAQFCQTAAKNNASEKKRQTVAKPLSAADLEAAEAKAKRQKLRKMAVVMQAKRLNAASTQVTDDDFAMAFGLAHR